MNVPKLRFKEFDGEWTKYLLNDLVDFHNNQRKPVKETDRISGEFPYYGASGIVGYVNDFIFEGEYLLLSEDGANIISRNLPIVYKTKGKFWVNNHAHIFTSKSFISQEFLFQYLEKINYIPFNSGTAQPKLNLDSIKSIPLFIPKYEEQEKLSDLLCRIDKKIQLQQQKIDLLQEQKKGFLQKMFPKVGETQPEMRLDGFTGDWEVYKWVDTVDISTNMVDPKNVEYDEFLHIGPGNIESFTGRILDNVNTVKEDNLISGKFHFKAGDIIYGKINPQLAKYTLVNFEGLASADAYILNAKNGINQQYLYTILQGEKFYKYSVSVSMRTGMPKINRDELNQYNYLAPNLKEQQKIGEFFKGLDNKIEVQKRKLQLLQKQKQGFMQQMFI
ncbi:Type I restriction modification DNA specificity domain protein [Metalysinibacillus saudimassiliensis]|uniref:Type I restriction modification DNA specificity domain protein n=1 Tax=Metalysinibacillus saudimassiliensis TaxID=1461583 RepID=A0A078M209_9BACL|nr:Type I restriction modification DNA specificity domain protein [Metalysinibacillus saudimassiliensis]